MLGGLFPNLFGGDNSGNTSLSTGAKPENLNGEEKSFIAKHTVLPSKITQADVNRAAATAGELEAQTVLLKHGSEQYLAVQQAALNNLEERVKHQQKSMENTKQFQKKMSRHGKNIYEYQVGTQATKANFDAYESAFNSVEVEL